MHKGKVVLVGAGPGDPGLFTIRGKEALQSADVVVYDRLVCDDVLDYAAEAKLIYVGKEQGHHPTPQHEINAILVQEAQKGSLVVRLKGGDPYVFGRGSEEVEELIEADIPFEVVPGVTSALAALSYAGIPATARGIARSVHVITGHAKANEPLDIDYDALKRTQGTLVFLMAVSSTPAIVEGLLAAGMPADTPAAFVENGTLPTQRRIAATLDTIFAQAQATQVESPAILVVGEVCKKADALDWFSARPLFGKTIIVTRPKSRTGTLSSRLRALGAQVISMPCIETRPLDSSSAKQALGRIDEFSWLVLTSPQGVECLFSSIDELERDTRMLASVKVAAIGASTARELATRGIKADFIPDHYDAKHLAEGLAKRASPSDKVLLLRAEQGTLELLEILAQAQISVEDIATYETLMRCTATEEIESLLKQGSVDYVTFTSASTVDGFAACIPAASTYDFTGLCIGDATEARARKKGYQTLKAPNATIDHMIDALRKVETYA